MELPLAGARLQLYVRSSFPVAVSLYLDELDAPGIGTNGMKMAGNYQLPVVSREALPIGSGS